MCVCVCVCGGGGGLLDKRFLKGGGVEVEALVGNEGTGVVGVSLGEGCS